MGIASLGHAVFAATMVALGIVGLIQGGFTPTWSGVPKGLPAREALAYLCAFISLVSGIGLLWRRAAVVASRVLLTSLLVWLLLFRVTLIFRAPTATVAWWASGDTAVMAAAAWVPTRGSPVTGTVSLDDVRVCLLDELAHSAEGFPAPVPEFGDSFRNELRCRHDYSFGAGHAQVRGREGPRGVSTPNCFAYSAFNRCQPPTFMASGPTMRPMG